MKAPGLWLRKLAACLFVDETIARVVDPALADLQAEWALARENGRVEALRIWIGGIAAMMITIATAFVTRRGSKFRALPWTIVGPALLSSVAGLFLIRRTMEQSAHGSLQARWLALGMIVLFSVACVPARSLFGKAGLWAALAAATVVLGVVFAEPWGAPAVAPTLVMPFGFPLQPNELAKPMFVAAIAGMLSTKASPWKLAACALLTSVCVAAEAARLDLGSTLVLLAAASAMIWVGAGSGWKRGVWILGSILAASVVWTISARAIPSFSAHSAAHTDGILAAALAQGGTRGLVVVAAALLLLLGALFARARTTTGVARLVTVGVATAFASQTLLHAAASVGLLPSMGLPLPLVSYGGSSLVSHMACLGLLASAVLGQGAMPRLRTEAF